MKKNNWGKSLSDKIIYLAFASVVVVSMFINYNFEVVPGKKSIEFFNKTQKLKNGGTVLVTISYNYSDFAEMNPLTEVVLKHLFKKNMKIVFVTSIPESSDIPGVLIKELLRDSHFSKKFPQEGRDYINLGYIPGGITSVGFLGTICKSIEFQNLKCGFDAIYDFSANNFAENPYSLYFSSKIAFFNKKPKIFEVCSADIVAEIYPFISSKEIYAVLPGFKMVPEYEKLLKGKITKSNASQTMDIVFFAFLFIILSIFVGNLAEFIRRRKK